MKLLSLIPKICQPSYTSNDLALTMPGTATAQYQATLAVDPDYRDGSSLLWFIEDSPKPVASHHADLFIRLCAFLLEKRLRQSRRRGFSACRQSLIQHDQAFTQQQHLVFQHVQP
ncbi:hypothetical protein HF864_03705 [Lactobacillus sp. MRS-253-APC-2B]|uniref:hypothetical protein n=1 Tax=Lactobacillus sp. MRS-253-APC-2B TaxID=2725305 RepID=UPI00146F5A12|nr:hypothetical protein [Lactobacillus sp. MRS-253-APC-2B]NME33894.1 hypothetical protein [Lactobacillus sp. MRS-253-APC-2B]